MKKKNGFTLVELLAVIVIIAIVALIGGTAIFSATEKAKKNTLGVEGVQLAISAESYKAVMDGISNGTSNLFESNDSLCIDLEYLHSNGYFPKGKADGYTGSIYIKNVGDGEFEYYFWISNGTYSYKGAKKNNYATFDKLEDGEVASSTCDIDLYIKDDDATKEVIDPYVGRFIQINETGDKEEPLIKDDIITPQRDSALFTPTNIVNGKFDENPWMAFTYKGVTFSKERLEQNNHLAAGATNITNMSTAQIQSIVNGSQNFIFDNQTTVTPINNTTGNGWNTTENRIYNDGKLFDWTKKVNGNLWLPHAINDPYNQYINTAASKDYSFIEMNAHEAAVFWQDLPTNSNDVIKWTLKHAVRPTDAGPATQNIYVEIGKPRMSGANYIMPHGIKTDLHTEIDSMTSALYAHDGITSTGNLGTGSLAELANLSLSKTGNRNDWYYSAGIYMVPEGQTTTRFSFVSDSEAGDGNLLDDITFSTLIGNLKIVYNPDGTATITGYWGEPDKSKKLIVIISSYYYSLDMSEIEGSFKVIVPKGVMNSAKFVEVYHEDYYGARKKVSISH